MEYNKPVIFFAYIFLFVFSLYSHVNAVSIDNVQTYEGTLLPVKITDKGELFIREEKHISFQPWNSTDLDRRVRTIHHMAGRSSAKKMNQPFIDALKEEKFDKAKYQTTTIVNLNDTIFGTTNIILKKIKQKKLTYPWSSIIADSKGIIRQQWRLNPKNSAIIIIDKDQKVLFFKEGALSKEEIYHAINLIKSHL